MAASKTIGQVRQFLEASEQTFHRWRNQYGGMKANSRLSLQSRPEHMASYRSPNSIGSSVWRFSRYHSTERRRPSSIEIWGVQSSSF